MQGEIGPDPLAHDIVVERLLGQRSPDSVQQCPSWRIRGLRLEFLLGVTPTHDRAPFSGFVQDPPEGEAAIGRGVAAEVVVEAADAAEEKTLGAVSACAAP